MSVCPFSCSSFPPFTTDPNIRPWPLTPVKSMQRAASSDTLSTMAFSNADAHLHKCGPPHDVKEQLSHSQSMILPENGKVFTSRAQTHKVLMNCAYSIRSHAEGRGDKLNICTYRQMNTADDAHFLSFSWSSSAVITPVKWPTSWWSLRLQRALQTAMAAHRWENTAFYFWNKNTCTWV